KRYKAFGRGSVDFLHPANPRVLAFIRRYEGELLLVVANLSRFVQYVELDLSSMKDMVPVELMGRTRFPRIGDAPYMLTLAPHGFYWFRIETPRSERVSLSDLGPPRLVCSSADGLLFGDERKHLEEVMVQILDARKMLSGPNANARILETVRIEGA